MGELAAKNFDKTLAQLASFLSTPIVDGRDRAGIIRAFEFTFEQCWKSAQNKALIQGIQVASPKQALSAAMQLGWISKIDEEKWLQMLKDCNLSSHSYKEDLAKEILARIQDQYLAMFKSLLQKISAD